MKNSVFIELGSTEADLDDRLGSERLQFQLYMKQPREVPGWLDTSAAQQGNLG